MTWTPPLWVAPPRPPRAPRSRSHASRALCALRASALVGVGLAAAACTPPFLPASYINEERVIAVTATPAEAVPGTSVVLTPTVVAPDGELSPGDGYAPQWWRCPDADSDALGDFTQCSDAASRVLLSQDTPYTDVVPSDLFGDLAVLPTDPPVDPATALKNDKLLGALLGYWRVMGFEAAGPQRTLEAIKRVPVYLPFRLDAVDARLADLDTRINAQGVLEPNTNPTMSGVVIHEDTVTGASTTVLASGGTYAFEPIYDERTLQEYFSLEVNLAGLDLQDPAALQEASTDELLGRFTRVQRCEIPVFSWFATAGRFRRDTTLDESVITRVYDPRGVPCPPVEGDLRAPEALYTPPTGDADDPIPADGVVRAWVVLRDGRGGTAVRAFTFALAS